MTEIPLCSFPTACEQAEQSDMFGCPQPEGQVVSLRAGTGFGIPIFTETEVSKSCP